MRSSTPQSYGQNGPSGFQLGQQQMAQFANQPNSLASILSGINTLTTPTKSPDSPSLSLVLNGVAPATHTGAGAFPAGGAGGAGSGGPPSTASTLSQYAGLGKELGNLRNLFGGSVPTGMAGTALGGAGLPSGLTAAQQASLTSAFTGAPVAGSLADAMGLTAGTLSPLAASALAPVGTGAITAAGNAAGASAASELASALGTAPAAAPAAAAPAVAAPAASGGSMGLGALAADAGVLAGMGYAADQAMTMPANNGWAMSDINQLGKNVQGATSAGLLSPHDTTAGSINPFNPNGSINQPLMSGLQSLQQLQMGNFGAANGAVQNTLNGLGYKTFAQSAGPNYHPTRGGAPASVAANLLRKRF